MTTLPCNCSCANATWYYHNQSANNDWTMIGSNNGSKYNIKSSLELQIFTTNEEDQGIYRCVGSSEDSSEDSYNHIFLDVDGMLWRSSQGVPIPKCLFFIFQRDTIKKSIALTSSEKYYYRVSQKKFRLLNSLPNKKYETFSEILYMYGWLKVSSII